MTTASSKPKPVSARDSSSTLSTRGELKLTRTNALLQRRGKKLVHPPACEIHAFADLGLRQSFHMVEPSGLGHQFLLPHAPPCNVRVCSDRMSSLIGQGDMEKSYITSHQCYTCELIGF